MFLYDVSLSFSYHFYDACTKWILAKLIDTTCDCDSVLMRPMTSHHPRRAIMAYSATPILNPYARRQERPPTHHEGKGGGGTEQDDSSMGRQRQHRKSAVRKAMQYGQLSRRASQKIGHFDHRQRAIDNITQPAFHPLLHCNQCIAEKRGKNPHRGHHQKCPRNRKTGGQSAREVEIERECNRLSSLNKRKMGDSDSTTPSVASCFAKVQLVNKMSSTLSPEVQQPGTVLPANSSPAEVALFLEKSVQTRKPSSSSLKCNASAAFVALAEAIMHQIKHKKPAKVSQELPVHVSSFREAQSLFHSIFGKNNFVYTVPEVTDLQHKVDPAFHALAGAKFIYMDMELAFPSLKICCCHCKSGSLSRARDIYSNDKRLFPIVENR
jgi:hypothetical protein